MRRTSLRFDRRLISFVVSSCESKIHWIPLSRESFRLVARVLFVATSLFRPGTQIANEFYWLPTYSLVPNDEVTK